VIAERIAAEIPEDDLRRQVDRALYPGVAPERKLAAFVEAFKGIVWNLDPSALEILYDVSGDPTLAVARLPKPALARVSDCIRRIFDPADSARILVVLGGTDEDPDAFTVLVRQQVRVEG
jgi:hypothetical protein